MKTSARLAIGLVVSVGMVAGCSTSPVSNPTEGWELAKPDVAKQQADVEAHVETWSGDVSNGDVDQPPDTIDSFPDVDQDWDPACAYVTCDPGTYVCVGGIVGRVWAYWDECNVWDCSADVVYTCRRGCRWNLLQEDTVPQSLCRGPQELDTCNSDADCDTTDEGHPTHLICVDGGCQKDGWEPNGYGLPCSFDWANRDPVPEGQIILGTVEDAGCPGGYCTITTIPWCPGTICTTQCVSDYDCPEGERCLQDPGRLYVDSWTEWESVPVGLCTASPCPD
jgi:hypothetical protein